MKLINNTVRILAISSADISVGLDREVLFSVVL